MPLYEQIILAIPKFAKPNLAALMKKHVKTVIENGGNVRGIENHGIRLLPERAKKRFATSDGTRYFWEARYISVIFDASPKGLVETERLLRNEEDILRFFTLKKLTAIEKCNARTYQNPYYQLPSVDPDK